MQNERLVFKPGFRRELWSSGCRWMDLSPRMGSNPRRRNQLNSNHYFFGRSGTI